MTLRPGDHLETAVWLTGEDIVDTSMLMGIALGLALGGVGGWLLGRAGEVGAGPRVEAARARADEIAKRVAQLDAALETRERDLADARQRSGELTEVTSWLPMRGVPPV